jgi:UDP-N-acetylmuramate: L-alanyl-gamma-D-glutamyl-meso-diaminopimelate ligase
MRIHIVACGGSIMHQLTIQLKMLGNEISCSDDEIFEPALGNLATHQLLPEIGWFPDNIKSNIDFAIIGMHAKSDNPELSRLKELNIEVLSYPEYIYKHSINKIRVAIAGSHGKTTTTAMVMHVLKFCNIDFDYLVGAKLEGFDYSIKLTNAPIIIIEADEYPDGAENKLPKFLFYKPHIASISGIAWDHINMFPTYELYKQQFHKFIDVIEPNGFLFINQEDKELTQLVSQHNFNSQINIVEFCTHPSLKNDEGLFLENTIGNTILNVFGKHNLNNISAALNICTQLGINITQFYTAISSFGGASKRLQLIKKLNSNYFYFDFAHSPSKVKATVDAVSNFHTNKPIIACLELHTFSSLSADFLNEYKNTLDAALYPIVFYSPKAIAHKNLSPISPNQILNAFANNELKVFTQSMQLVTYLKRIIDKDSVVLMMSSGNFDGLKMEGVANILF